MHINKQQIPNIPAHDFLSLPSDAIFALPERVLQFGTGVLLRGLPDYFIDKANKQGLFNGRVVVVKSTIQGDTDAFKNQDNLYTQLIRGIDNGKQVDKAVVNASLSRVMEATTEWQAVLDCAANPLVQIIISNTTEVGISLVAYDDIHASPPVSFPAKLLAFLIKRFEAFKGSAESGLVIIPTELITDNGTKLKNIVLQLAKQHGLRQAFTDWLNEANDFCNSLVDRIVPGKLPAADAAVAALRLGYTDELLIMSEVYSLWAIETSRSKTKECLSFAKAGEGVIVTDNILSYRELKLRLLNGAHSFTCGLAVLAGFTTVKEAMQHTDFAAFITGLMLEEIAPAIVSSDITETEANAFALKILDRFRNPFIEHPWLSISLQYSAKMKQRNIPTILAHYAAGSKIPDHFAIGFAAYLLFMRSTKKEDGTYTGNIHGRTYTIKDDQAAVLSDYWQTTDISAIASVVLKDTQLWGTALPDAFIQAVQEKLLLLQSNGARAILANGQPIVQVSDTTKPNEELKH